MPAYNTLAIPPSVAPGDQVQVWNAETPTPGNGNASASQQVALTRAGGVGSAVIAQGSFSAAPGAFEIDVQGNDTSSDSDANYQTLPGGNITAVDATNNTWRYDPQGILPARVRLLMRSRTNPVTATAFIGEH